LTSREITTAPRRVLIADDGVSSRDLLRSILESGGYAVDEARDGEQVLAMAGKSAPNVVILDLQTPRLDGYVIAAALRRMPTLESIPIIALTPAITQTVPEQLSRAGFTAYLVKPISPARLRQCVQKALKGR